MASLSDSMSKIRDIATRVDERVNILLERQSASDANIHDIRKTINELGTRLDSLESTKETQPTNTVLVINFVGKVLWILTASIVLYKLGFSPA